MPVYTCVYATTTATVFNAKKDAGRLNAMLEELQSNGAKIIDIKVSVGGGDRIVQAVYLVIYEAPEPLC